MKMCKALSLVALLVLVLISSCKGRNLFESEDFGTVVSKYTTLPPTMKTPPPLDVYQQIARNIAEKVTSPIYRLFGYDTNKTTTTVKPTWGKLELVDEVSEEVTKPSVNPVSNDIDTDRDVEELSEETLKKTKDKKPEKITLYSSYLPLDRVDKDVSKGNINSGNASTVSNGTVNSILDDDDDFNFDEFEDEDNKNFSGGFVYILELIGSVLTLAWGAIMAYFRPSSGSS